MCLATVTFGVSTHSHPKAAAARRSSGRSVTPVSTHSRAEAAARPHPTGQGQKKVSTHSRAEAAAILLCRREMPDSCFNTQPRGGGCISPPCEGVFFEVFQHTAARRRLLFQSDSFRRAKAFQHTAARRRLRLNINTPRRH